MKRPLLAILYAALAIGCGSQLGSNPDANGSPDSDRPPSETGKETPPRPSATAKAAVVIETKTPPKNGFLMRVKPKQGATVHYVAKSHIDIYMDKTNLPQGQPTNQSLDVSVGFDVTPKETKDGKTTLNIVASNVQITQNGNKSSFNAPHADIVVDDRSRVLTPFSDPLVAIMGIGFVPFPQNPVLPGSDWRVEGQRDVPRFGGNPVGLPQQMEMTEVYRLVSGGANSTWTIESSATAKGIPISSKGTYKFNPADGLLVNATVTQNAEVDVSLSDKKKTVRTTMKQKVSVTRSG